MSVVVLAVNISEKEWNVSVTAETNELVSWIQL